MGIQTGLIIAIILGLLGVFFSIRAGLHSTRVSRRQASWPQRIRQVAASRRYFGLAFFLMVAIIAGVVYIFTGKVTVQVVLSTPTASLEWTATTLPPETQTDTPALTSTPAPAEPPTLTPASSLTFTRTPVPSWTPRPTDTHWPTWTASRTSTVTLTPLPTLTPTGTSTRMPTQTLIPTDTHWPVLTSNSIK